METFPIRGPAPELEQAQPLAKAQAVEPAPPQSLQPDLRLVIEGRAGAFVYKTVDRLTGEVVQQLPREQVVRMRDAETYEAGSLVNTQA